MAHFAKLEGNIVTDIVVISNDEILDDDGNESEAMGVAFLQTALGADTVSVSYTHLTLPTILLV